MFDKDQFLASMARETKICKHLHSKIDSEQLDYRPAESMRSTAELLGYLATCGAVPTTALVSDDWSERAKASERAGSVTHDNFVAVSTSNWRKFASSSSRSAKPT